MKYLLTFSSIFLFLYGCKKNQSPDSQDQNLVDTVSHRTILFLDSIGVPNPTLQEMVGYDGNPLGKGNNIERLSGDFIDFMLDEAQSLSDQKNGTVYVYEGIDKPEHTGLVYSYGQRDFLHRLKPTSGSDIHKKYAVFGTDCSGLIINLLRKAGLNISTTDVEHFETTLRLALSNNSNFNTLTLNNLGNIPASQLKSGDFILWINPPSERHMGIISAVPDKETVVFQSNGDPTPITEADQLKNIGPTRGVHPISFIKATTGNGYWGTDYKILRIEDPVQTVTDIDGNLYKSVTIGNQVWLAENLKVTRYKNGDQIPQITNDAQWASLTTGAYCNYNNDASNSTVYGKLYNWYAISDSRGIAPAGWHIPSDAEWTTLTTYLGGSTIAANKLKEAGIAHWVSPNTASTNSSGFKALPGGGRLNTGGINSLIGERGYWWSSTEQLTTTAWNRALVLSSANVFRTSISMNSGYSIRCIKD
jgi:uncharacterized protein (TIGR02145 family)